MIWVSRGFFLSIEMVRDGDRMILSQHRYMIDILTRANMSTCKALATLISVSHLVDANVESFFDSTKYQSLVCALQYLTVTRPCLSFAVNRLCQYMHSLTMVDWVALKRVLRYVKGTLDSCLCLKKSLYTNIHAFSESD